jgi:hypothetical protein
MAQLFHRAPVRVERGQPLIAKNSGAFAEADPVGINSDGYLETVSAGQKILGWATETITVDSDNTTVDKYCPEFVIARDVEMVFPSSEDCAQSDLNLYKDFSTVTSGSFVVGMSDITGGQVKVLAFDPYSESDNDVVVVVASELEENAYAQP